MESYQFSFGDAVINAFERMNRHREVQDELAQRQLMHEQSLQSQSQLHQESLRSAEELAELREKGDWDRVKAMTDNAITVEEMRGRDKWLPAAGLAAAYGVESQLGRQILGAANEKGMIPADTYGNMLRAEAERQRLVAAQAEAREAKKLLDQTTGDPYALKARQLLSAISMAPEYPVESHTKSELRNSILGNVSVPDWMSSVIRDPKAQTMIPGLAAIDKVMHSPEVTPAFQAYVDAQNRNRELFLQRADGRRPMIADVLDTLNSLYNEQLSEQGRVSPSFAMVLDQEGLTLIDALQKNRQYYSPYVNELANLIFSARGVAAPELAWKQRMELEKIGKRGEEVRATKAMKPEG